MKSAKSIFSVTSLSTVIVLTSINSAVAGGIQAWCGNGCSSDPDTPSGISCTNWEHANKNSICQAKAVCSSHCTVLNDERDRIRDFSLIKSEQDLKRFRAKLNGISGVKTVTKDKFILQINKSKR